MPSHELPPASTLTSLSSQELASVLDCLFEPCVPLHTLSVPLLRRETFSTYADLIAGVGMQLTDLSQSSSTSDKRWLDSILGAHPRMGERNIGSEQRVAKQAQLTRTATEAKRLTELNVSYEMTFPGLRYVAFADGRDRDTMLDDMEFRIDRGDMKLERAEAIKAMRQIAADRSRRTPIRE